MADVDSIDYDSWGKKDRWSFEEAAALSLGHNPDSVNEITLGLGGWSLQGRPPAAGSPTWPDRQLPALGLEYALRLSRVVDAIYAETLVKFHMVGKNPSPNEDS